MPRRPNPRCPARAGLPPSVAFRTRPLVLVLALASAFASMPARPQPAGAAAIHGTATLSQQGSRLVVTTTNGAGTGHSAINWQSFSIPGGTSTHFAQPNAASTSINRVVGPDPSAIFGTLSSNGRLVLVNPAGITVGAGAVVDTAGFTASTLRMTDADALAGRLRFAGGGGPLKVDGHVVARHGDVVLIAPQLATGAQAIVESPQGATVLAAGQKVELTGRGLEGIHFEVQAPADRAVNLGTLRGDAVGVFAGTLQHSGLVQAQAVTTEGGKVVLRALDQAVVAGQVRAQGDAGAGGQVDVLGAKVGLVAGAVVDTSNTAGGGQIRIGGDYQGANAGVPNAQVTYVDRDAQLLANATGRGDGGKVIVWADDTTRMFGAIEARGGAQGGDGGFVETSGKRFLDVEGARVSASAPAGRAGTWLLDPSDIYIVSEFATPGPTPPPEDLGTGPNFTSAAGSTSSRVTDATIRAALDSATSVTIATDGGSGSGGGNIYFGDGGYPTLDIKRSATGSVDLNLVASNSIVFKSGTTTYFRTGTGSGRTLNVNFNVGATGQVLTEGGATVHANTLDNASFVKLNVLGGKTWNQQGHLQLDLNAKVDLSSGATLNNQGTMLGAMGPGGGILGGTFLNSGSVILSEGRISVGNLQHTGSTFNLGNGTDLTVYGSFSATGPFYFYGRDLSITQLSGALSLPSSAYVDADGHVRLEAPAGDVNVDGFLHGGTLTVVAGGNINAGASSSLGTWGVGAGYTGDALLRANGSISFNSIDTTPFSGTSGGHVTLVAQGAVTGNQISTYSFADGRGGNVQITGNGDVTVHGIDSSGGGGLTAGQGGNVTIASSGHVSVDYIDAYGGYGSMGSAGGAGGHISISAAGGVTLDDLNAEGGGGGDITATSGQAGDGGRAGSISIEAGGHSTISGEVAALGGDGGDAPAGGTARGGNGGAGGPIRITLRDGATLLLGSPYGYAEVMAGAGRGGQGADPSLSGAAGASSTVSTSGGTILVPTAYSGVNTGPSAGADYASLNIDGHWQNSSNLVLDPGAWVRVNGPVSNSGTVDVGHGALLSLGFYDDPSDTFTPGGVAFHNLAGAVLQGSGTVQADVSNAGTVAPGGLGPIGQLTILGNLQQEATGMLKFDVAPGTPYVPGYNYDQLVVSGQLGLGGQLLVNQVAEATSASHTPSTPYPTPTPTSTLMTATALAATSMPAETATYELMHAGSTSGSGFALVSGPADLLAQARMVVGGVLQEIPGGTVTQLIAAIAQLLPGVSVAQIQQVLTESLTSSISSGVLPEEEEEGPGGASDIVVTDAACKPS